MSTVTGMLTSYGLTGGVPVTIDAVIDLLDPTDLPFQNGFMLGGMPALPRSPAENRKEEWQDDSLLDPITTLNEGGTLTAADTVITVTDGTRIKVGDVLRCESESMYVTGVSTNDITVTRGFAGTTAATHDDSSNIFVTGQALAEGSDAVQASHTDRTRRYNYTQILGPRKIKVSGTELVMPKYGLMRGGEFLYQVDKESMEMAKSLERTIIYGERYEDSSSDQRTMGGLLYFITTNVDSASANITIDKINDQLEAMYNAGASPGSGWVFAANLANKRIISNFYDNAASSGAYVDIMRGDNGRGEVVEYLDTDVGRVQFLVSRYFQNKDAVLLTRDQVTFMTLRPWQIEPLAKTGDAETVQIVGEFTLKVKKEKHAAKFTGLTQS